MVYKYRGTAETRGGKALTVAPNYFIFMDGRLWNAKTSKWMNSSISKNTRGPVYQITVGENRLQVNMDRIVMSYFHTDAKKVRYHTIEHIDGDPENCHITNLRLSRVRNGLSRAWV